MPIGPAVRSRLGRFETPAAEAYRSVFFSLDDFSRQLRGNVPDVRRILEIGCGDGSVANSIAKAYPEAEYVGIDISPEPGRRFEGDRARFTFESVRSGEFLQTNPEPFDLVLVIDVLHHVPHEERPTLLADGAMMLTPGGVLAIKDWYRLRSLPYLLGAAADRYVSGDHSASFMSPQELRQLIAAGCPQLKHRTHLTIKPWACNGFVVLDDPRSAA